MPRAIRLLAAREKGAPSRDTLILTYEQRRSQRASVVSVRGVAIDLDLPEPMTLRTDDVLLLDSDEQVDIVAAAEPLMEVRAELSTLARVAWALGDRHVPVQIMSNRMRLHRDAAMASLAISLGCKVTDIEAPFDPEGGAYAVNHANHDHDHGDHHHHQEHSHRS